MSIGEIPAVEEAPPFVDMPIDDEETEPKAIPLEVLLGGAATETINVMEALSPEDLTKLGADTHRKVERDWKSGEKWRKRHANILKLYFGDLPPLPNGEELANAQVHYPIVATAVTRIGARIYDQQFPSNGEYFGCKYTDATDTERSIRIAKHMNWTVEHKMPEYVFNYDVLIIQMLLYGSAFTMLYWDHVAKSPRHEVIPTEDIILPYKRFSNDPNMGDMPRITRVLRKYRYELEELEEDGYYVGIAKLYEEDDERGAPRMSLGDTSNEPVQKAVDHDAGTDKSDDDPDAPRVLWEMHTWYRFEGEKKSRPVIVTIDKQTKTVICLKIREDEDQNDRARYNRERDAFQAQYDAAMAQYQMDLVQYLSSGGAPGMAGPPMPGTMDATSPPMPGETTAPPMVDPNMPQPPPPPQEPAKPRMVPINHFYHHRCLPNPEGVYGNGIGTWLEGPNMFADTVGAQIVNAGTLANTKGGFISRQLRSVRGEVRFRPGEFTETDAVGKLSDLIMMMDFPPPDPTMGQLIKDQQEAAAEVSGANEILSGEVGGSNETATTTQIRMSAAMTNIAIINKRETKVRTCEGRGIARLLSVHVSDDEYFCVVDPYKQVPGQGPVVEELHIARADYLQDWDITITADPRMSSQPQRVAEAMGALTVISQNPVLMQNIPLVQAAAREYFIAIDRPQLVAAMMAGMPFPMPGQVPPVAPGGAMPPGAPEEGGGGPPQPSPIPPPIPGTTQPPNTQEAPQGETT